MNRNWEEFRIAGGFLTIFPVDQELEVNSERLARSMAFFPAVGLTLGLMLVFLNWMLAPLIPLAVLDCLLLLILIAVTGALHLDGIADLIDGLAGGKDRAGVLEVMRDNRVGAIGVVGLVMVLLLKYLSLYHVPLEHKYAALMFMPAAGRWIQVALCGVCSGVGDSEDSGGILASRIGEREMLVATLTLALAALILFGFKGILLLLLIGLLGWLLWRYFDKRLGGVTASVLGAATEVVEVVTLILVLALH